MHKGRSRPGNKLSTTAKSLSLCWHKYTKLGEKHRQYTVDERGAAGKKFEDVAENKSSVLSRALQ